MNALARHLTAAAGHGRLPFHPACPTCRDERLAGTLPAQPVVSPRTRAGLVAAVLATSAAVPAAALAQARPVAEEDTVEPDPGLPADVGGLDPGAASVTDAPLGDEDALGTPEGQGDAGPLGPEAVEEQVEDAPAPAGPEVSAPGQAGVELAPTEPKADDREPVAKADEPEREPAAKHRPTAPAPEVAPAPRAAPATPASPVPVADPVAIPVSAKGARYHVVQAGESLWSIARDRLGDGARNAEIAREVKRIWDLNAETIGTGDPNLVMVGQKLRLS